MKRNTSLFALSTLFLFGCGVNNVDPFYSPKGGVAESGTLQSAVSDDAIYASSALGLPSGGSSSTTTTSSSSTSGSTTSGGTVASSTTSGGTTSSTSSSSSTSSGSTSGGTIASSTTSGGTTSSTSSSSSTSSDSTSGGTIASSTTSSSSTSTTSGGTASSSTSGDTTSGGTVASSTTSGGTASGSTSGDTTSGGTVASSTTSGGSSSSDSTSGGTVVITPPDEGQIQDICEARPHHDVTYRVNFPAMTHVCKWGQNGNGWIHDRQFRARAEQIISVPVSTLLPSNGVMCGLKMLSVNSSGKATKFDDEVLFTMVTKGKSESHNTILSSSVDYSDRFDYVTSANGIKFYQYDFTKMLNTIYVPEDSDGEHYYCLGKGEGSSCAFPPTETYGNLSADVVDDANYKLAEWIAGASEVSVEEVVTGDNDATDCQITAVSLDITLSYATP